MRHKAFLRLYSRFLDFIISGIDSFRLLRKKNGEREKVSFYILCWVILYLLYCQCMDFFCLIVTLIKAESNNPGAIISRSTKTRKLTGAKSKKNFIHRWNNLKNLCLIFLKSKKNKYSFIDEKIHYFDQDLQAQKARYLFFIEFFWLLLMMKKFIVERFTLILIVVRKFLINRRRIMFRLLFLRRIMFVINFRAFCRFLFLWWLQNAEKKLVLCKKADFP